MKQIKLLMVAFLAMIGSSAYAVDYIVDQRFTSVAELDGKLFTVVNEAESKAFCFTANHNLNYEAYSTAMSSNSYYFKIEAVPETEYFYLRSRKPDGSEYAYYGGGGYLNSQSASGSVSFSLGLTDKKGQDIENGAVWALEESGDGKIAIKNIGTGKYLKDAASAKYDNPTYFTFCTLKLDLSSLKKDYDALKAKLLAINAGIDVSAADALADAAASEEDYAKANAALVTALKNYLPSSEGDIDVTSFLLVNPSFENNFTGWEQSGMGIQGNDAFGKDGSKYAEAWQPNGTKKVSQNLTEMPKGHYTLTVRVKARGMTSAKVFAGSDVKDVTIEDAEKDYTVEFSCIGDVEIGVEGVGTKADNSWFALDNFRLTYTGGLTEDEFATLALKQAIEDAKTVAAARPVGDVLFAVPTADNTTLNKAITAAQTVYDNTAATTAEKTDAASKLNAAVDTYKAVSINKPEAGKAYFLKQKNTSLYMNLTEAVKITAEPYAIQFIANGDGWTIASAANKEVTAGMAGGNSWSMSNNKDTAWKFNLKDAAEGTYTIKGPNGLIGSDNTTAGSSCYGNKGEANNGLWIIEEAATLAVAAANEYATFVAPFDVTIPAGVKAYTVDGVTGAELNMTEVTTTIKANTPVVLQATTDVNEKFYGVAVAGTPKVGLLTGVYTDTPAPEGTYVLQNQGEGAKFYLVEAGKQPTVKAGHAYLTASSAGVKAFGFDAIATAITELTEKTEATEGVIYNLQGQRVNTLQRGINIVNGKKVLVK